MLSIELLTGYTDRTGTVHREVEFGRRVSVGDMMLLDSDPRAANATQYNDLLCRKMITRFGSLPLPIAETVLLSLDSVDREDVQVGVDRFLETSRADRKGEIGEDACTLAFGFDIDGVHYDVVKFGRFTTGHDELQADVLGLKGISRECYLLGRQIESVENADGRKLEGAIAVEHFATLDGTDLVQLRIGARLRRLSFRLSRERVPSERTGADDLPADGSDRDERAGTAVAADAAA